MQKTPVKGTHTRARGLWPQGPKVEAGTAGELKENRERLDVLIIAANEKMLEIGAIMSERAGEHDRLQKELDAAFRKMPGTAHQKVLARSKEALESQLHHTLHELKLKRLELKKIHREVNSIKQHPRKSR